ncbi:hypothetical protein [Methylobacterium sp. Leaf100]|uniref:hypothetical protein n=1 Tax=Methylobacterium sp. Leaf100 TaxID=1736252 RepID=UPI0006F59F87|nr:hypothetical protein [Methylobacterium sp. Leaf100]
MADHTDTTPVPARPNDRELAAAYRDMEGAICNLRSMALLMGMTVEDTVIQGGGALVDHIKRQAGPMKGYRIVVMTEEQSESLEYALNHISDLAINLSRTYYAGFGEKAA